jgi:hypothetical protein
LILSFFLQYSRYKEVRDALDIAHAEMQKKCFGFEESIRRALCPCYGMLCLCWFLSRAHSRMEQIADILDTTSDKLQEALGSPSSDVEDTMYDWDWLQQHGIDMQQP